MESLQVFAFIWRAGLADSSEGKEPCSTITDVHSLPNDSVIDVAAQSLNGVILLKCDLSTRCLSLAKIGFQAIAEALGMAAVKAIVGGRLLLRSIYKQIAENQNAEIFAACTLLVILGTSLLTARAGLSMALGAFLAGLLLAETEFSLQVESDIAPYRGLLLGLFFMTVMDTLAEIQERHDTVKELERRLLELQQIFVDMAVLIDALLTM